MCLKALLCFASSLVEFCYSKEMMYGTTQCQPQAGLALARQSMNRSSCNVNYSSVGTVSQFSRHWVKIRNFKDLVLVLYPPTFFGIELELCPSFSAACRTTSEEASVNTAVMYLDGSAKFWWRTKRRKEREA